MKLMFLKGKNIYLRALTEKDITDEYISWFNDSEVCQYNSHHIFPYTTEKAEEYLNMVNHSRNYLVLAIVEKTRNKHIGNVSLQEINFINQNAELAIIIGDKNSWGKGYAKEAAKLIMEHGFMELNLRRIYSGVAGDNPAAHKLNQSIGMVQEGCRRQAVYKHGIFGDIFEFGILKEEFVKKQKEHNG